MKKLRGKLRTTRPRVVRLIGKFGLFRGDGFERHFDFVFDGALTNLDSVIREIKDPTILNPFQDRNIWVKTSDSVTSAAAAMDFGALGCTNLDSLIAFGTVGAAGNDWKVNVVPRPPDAGGVIINEDLINQVLTCSFEDGVSTVAVFEAAIGGTVNFVVAGAGTAGNVLASANDEVYNQSMASGVDTCVITVTHSADGKSHYVDIGFEDAVTTVLEVETAIGALAGTDAVIEVRDTGTAVNVLPAGADTLALTKLKNFWAPNQTGRGVLALRSGDGLYNLLFTENGKPVKIRAVRKFKGNLEHGAAAAFPGAVHQIGPLTALNDLHYLPIAIYDKTAAARTETNYTAANKVTFTAEVLL